jgi:two-component system, sensor histidine kinase and response regulator
METLRVLVTDDELGMRLGVARALRDYTVFLPDVKDDVRFTVEQAETGEEALEFIRRQPPDILLLDHKMPGISGLEVLDQVADMNLHMLTIMITAYASIETAVLATRRGADEFLPKPFTPGELRNAIQRTAARLLLARRARLLAEEKRQVRFEFIRVLGHELKAPLAAVTGYFDLIRERRLGEDLSSYDEVLGRCAVRIDGMRKLIHDLLDLTRIESGLKARELAPVDVREMVRNAVEAVQPLAGPRGITIEPCEGEPMVLPADAGEIEMICNNLLSNAVKYNRDGGRVSVKLERAGRRIVLAVSDTGIGISPESLPRIFDEFVRIKNSDTVHVDGTGLGLPIVRKLVQLYGGRVSAESEPGKGTTITVVLDAQAPAEVPAGTP